MEWQVYVRQLLVFIHLLAFVAALSNILREDWRVLVLRQLDGAQLSLTARRVSWALLILWQTGLVLLGMEVGGDLALLAAKPKLMMKLLVVSLLTVNGVLLHTLALPVLSGRHAVSHASLVLATILGAVSTVSWLFASFTGAGRVVAPLLRLPHYFGLYVAALAVGVAVGLCWVRPRLASLASRSTRIGCTASGTF